ncbi:putative zinc-binding oxidoreductase [Xylariaceae sp. FL0016]|nr:putative zinc-binding oxidoreductase [Xylariaceae sp. FL0016]
MASLPKTMRAIVCTATGVIDVMKIQDLPLPSPQEGQALIKILGFGINRAEMFTRQGHSPGVEFPRIIGIECIGIAEYTCVSEQNIRPIPPTNLPISTLAALPEMLQTTWGALVAGLDLRPSESLLVRGSTSSIGLCALQLARKIGASRIGATSRNPQREQMLRDSGADEVFIDDGEIAQDVQRSAKGGFDKVLELNGTTTLLDSLKCVVSRGTVCMTGIQGGEWEMDKFAPMADLPNRARVCGYGGGPDDFMAMPWEALVRDVEEGRVKVPVLEFKMEEIHQVHKILESGGGGAKMVVVVGEE